MVGLLAGVGAVTGTFETLALTTLLGGLAGFLFLVGALCYQVEYARELAAADAKRAAL